jgi:hypothetical protein
MRKLLFLAAAAVAAGALTLAGQPAYADDPAVLTTGSASGTNATVGDTLAATLATGTTADFFTTATGTTGVTCTTSTFNAAVADNPAAGGTATESLTVQTFTGCTSNILGVTAVNSITVDALPYSAAVGNGSIVLTGNPIQATVVLRTILGSVTCVYQADNGTLTGTTDNADNSINFTAQGFTKSTGPSLCPGSSFFTATYAPVVDSSIDGSPAVFVN